MSHGYPGDETLAVGGGEREPVGIFPSWRWVYATVVVYGVALILLLTVLSRILDFGVGS